MAPVAAPDSYSFRPGRPIYAGLPDPSVEVIQTLVLVNDGATDQPAGVVSKMVGLSFRQGDMPAGDWPLLEVEVGTQCPATYWGAATWPDGSLKFVGCMARIPVSIPASGEVEVRVKRGGTLNTTTTRSTADLTAADLKTVLQGSLNLTGEWTASLNDGITSGPVVLLGSGPAGSIWRIGSEFRDGSNAAHGQLYQHHFVAALTDSSGGLAGLRYLGRPMQMWGDVITPQATRRVFTAQLRSGATVVRSIVASTTRASVLGPDISMPHYSSWFTSGGGAEYDFVPGTQLNECAVYWKHEAAYLATNGVFPRLDVTISETINAPAIDYVAYGKGNVETYEVGGANRQDEIGAMNRYAALHMINQSAEALTVVRVNGLSAGGYPMRFIDRQHQSVMPCVDFGETYPNMNPVVATLRFNQSSEIAGNPGKFLQVSDKTSLWTSVSDITHRPGVCWYPYLVTGEPQYLDMVVESAAQAIASMAPGVGEISTARPVVTMTTAVSSTLRSLSLNGVTYPGAGWFARTELPRMFAWAVREMGHAAAFSPDVCPRGSGTKRYFTQIVDDTFKFARDYREFQTANGNLGYEAEGHFFHSTAAAMFALGHLHQTICHVSSALPTENATGFRRHLSKFWNAISKDIDMACVSGYIHTNGSALGRTETLATSTFAAGQNGHMDVSYDVGTSRVTIIGSLPWVPTVGDKFRFFDTSFNPFGSGPDQTYYAVNVSGLTFQLSETPGGAPATMTSGIAITRSFYCALQNYPALYGFQQSSGPEDYFANVRASILAMRAAGEDVETAHTKMQAKMLLSGIDYRTNPKFAYAGASTGT